MVDSINNAAIQQNALYVIQRLREMGYEAFWVGGCVRDMLMGIPPKDIDVATNAPPHSIAGIFPETRHVGAKFGVVIVLHGDSQIETATFRSDDVYEDHRHPRSVTFSTAQKDALRRDFTINALFYDPVKEKVLDYVGGMSDLHDKIIRAVGEPEQRFKEDALRMLRAVRFAARFRFTIETQTWTAIPKNVSLINEISPDRIRDELIAMFTNDGAGNALQLLDQSGLLHQILPEVEDMKGIPQPEEFHPEGDVFDHTVLALEQLHNPSTTLAFGILLHDVGKPPTYRVADRIRFDLHDKIGSEIADVICRRLNFSNKDRQQIVALVKRHMQFLNIANMRPATLRRFMSGETFEEDLELHRIDCLASHQDLANYEFCLQQYRELKESEGAIIPPPLITGNDLLQEGYKPGPLYSTILDAVAEQQLEGSLTSKEAALSWVKEHFSPTE